MTTETEIDPAYRAARARLEERRNRWTTYTEAEHLRAKLEGRILRESSIHDPEFRPAATAAEAFDDLMVQVGSPANRGIPEFRFLAGLASAARDGGATAAVKSVKDARQLTPAQQHATYENLLVLKKEADSRFADMERVFSTVLAEWERLDLAQGDERHEAARKAVRKRGAA
jgi:hypothetical protein